MSTIRSQSKAASKRSVGKVKAKAAFVLDSSKMRDFEDYM